MRAFPDIAEPMVILALAAVLLASGCSESASTARRASDRASPSAAQGTDPVPGDHASSEPASPSADASYGARLTILGDSNASATSCPGCTIFPERVAAAMGKALATDVELVNLAWDITNPKAAEVADIVKYLRTDPSARDTLAGSDAVLILVSQNDLAYNRLDDPCGVAPRYPRIRWADLTHECIDGTLRDYARDLEELLDEIDHVRSGRPTMLRIVSAYNTAIGDLVDPTWNSPAAIEPSTHNVAGMATIQCRAAKRHGGLCADALHALNGDGRQSAQRFLNPADATHLSQRGHNVVARLITALGFQPLDTQP